MLQSWYDAWLHQLLAVRNSIGRIALRPGVPRNPLTRLDVHRVILEKMLPQDQEVTQIIDLGPASWFYLPALLEVAPRARIIGVELDPYRRFRDLYTRAQHAQAHVQRAIFMGRDVQYLQGDGFNYRLPNSNGSTLVTIFFPFVFSGTARKWGIPASYVRWRETLNTFRNALRSDDRILIVHADQTEVQETRKIFPASIWKAIDVPNWGPGQVWASYM